jgi:hypothetical protein
LKKPQLSGEIQNENDKCGKIFQNENEKLGEKSPGIFSLIYSVFLEMVGSVQSNRAMEKEHEWTCWIKILNCISAPPRRYSKTT